MRLTSRLAVTAVVASFLGAGATVPSHAADLRECSGLDYIAVKNVSCGRAKDVVAGAREKVWQNGGYRVRFDGYVCVFPYEDYYSMNCVKRVDGKTKVIKYAGD